MKLKELLLIQKRELFNQIALLELGREIQQERAIEPGDVAQKEDLMRLLDHLIERGNEEIREINLALEKTAAGKYGICEICARRIQTKRLKALPATRLCRKCALDYEKDRELRKHSKDEIIDDVLLDEYRYLLYEDVPRTITRLSENDKTQTLKKA